MKKKEVKSDVIDLLDLVWSSANDSTGFSWERLNHGMRAALSLAIGSGFKFAEDDMKYIFSNYRSGYWLGDTTEWIYTEAIGVENDTAIKSYEKLKNREPIIADEVDGNSRSQFSHGNNVTRAKCRLFVGARFVWRGIRVTVTSFAEDSSYCTACSYKPRAEGSYENKIDKRFKISRADIITERAERKAAAKKRPEPELAK